MEEFGQKEHDEEIMDARANLTKQQELQQGEASNKIKNAKESEKASSNAKKESDEESEYVDWQEVKTKRQKKSKSSTAPNVRRSSECSSKKKTPVADLDFQFDDELESSNRSLERFNRNYK